METREKKEKIVMAVRRLWEKTGRGKVLLAVSGGADSTALLMAFTGASIPVEVAHCNFNLRSMESIRDREFVAMLCRKFGVKLHIAEFDVARQALKGESTEMTCRRLRYDYFRRLREEGGFSRIATGHNSDDNIETFFLNTLRGSGSKGLKGMDFDNGEIIRPLLGYTRREIIEYLKVNGQNYVTDSSNLKSADYRRNFLRNEVIPMLKTKWEGFDKAIATTIDLQKRENRIVEHFISKTLEGITDFLPWHLIYNFPDAETLIYNYIKGYGGTPTIAREMATSAARLLPGKKWRLADDTTALFTRKGILIEHPEATVSPQIPNYIWEKLEGAKIDHSSIATAPLSEIYLPFGRERYLWTPATIKMRIKSLGMEGSQPVWKVLKDAGLTPSQRHTFQVLTDKETGEPIWLPGIKRARLHLVAPDAGMVYRVS